jgi:putative membrane protein
MKNILTTLSVAAFLAAGCAANRHEHMGASASGSESVSGSAGVAAEDSHFARQACQAGAAEMEIGKLAAQNTRNRDVRRFASTLSKDHARAEKELAAIFARKEIAPEPQLADSFQHSLQRLAEMKGGAFDAAFKEQVIADHEKAIALFEKQAAEGSDSDLKAFAQRRLPHLRDHLEMARALPVSADTEGPVASPDVNTVLQNPGLRTIPVR